MGGIFIRLNCVYKEPPIQISIKLKNLMQKGVKCNADLVTGIAYCYCLEVFRVQANDNNIPKLKGHQNVNYREQKRNGFKKNCKSRYAAGKANSLQLRAVEIAYDFYLAPGS
jgi:hypothetical protein